MDATKDYNVKVTEEGDNRGQEQHRQDPEIVIVDAEDVTEQYQPHTKYFTPSSNRDDEQEQNRCSGFDFQLCGDDRFGSRYGRQVRPGLNFGLKLCGNTSVTIPITNPSSERSNNEAELATVAHYKFVRVNLCGKTTVYCPRGTHVTLRRISLCGNRRINVDEGGLPHPCTKVTVTVVQLCGDVHVLNLDDDEE